jgi:RNA polymerase sigma-70 factor, ECF subfamily
VTDPRTCGHPEGGKASVWAVRSDQSTASPERGSPQPAREAERTSLPSLPCAAPELSELFEQHADFVHRALLRLGVPLADADDSLQEVFLVVAHRLDSYVERGAMRAWLFVIARQVALHVHRARRRRARQTLELVPLPQHDDPQAILLRQEAMTLINDFLAELDARLAHVFYLAEIEQLSAPEIAAALGVKLNTVYSRLRLARRQFEKRVAQLGEGAP